MLPKIVDLANGSLGSTSRAISNTHFIISEKLDRVLSLLDTILEMQEVVANKHDGFQETQQLRTNVLAGETEGNSSIAPCREQ